MKDPFEESRSEGYASDQHPDNDVGCQPAALWLEVCANRTNEESATAYLRHASRCRGCSALLQEAAAVLGNEASPEEEKYLDEMATSTEAGRTALAERLYRQATKNQGARLTGSVRRWRLPWPLVAVASMALCAVVWLAVVYFRPHSESRLLAMAYDKQRPSELRIPGSEPGPLISPTRGKSAEEPASRELLQLKLRAREQFERDPNDARVRQTLGRIAIVEHDGEIARREFEMAEVLDPHLAGLKFDLASAEFVSAETTGQMLGYARAIDLFSQYLQEVHQNDAVALFDRGLCWERQSVTTEAIKDYEAALAVEKDPHWRKEIEQRLATLRESNSETTTQNFQKSPLTATAFLGLKGDLPGQYETYLDVAGRDWLVHRGDRSEVDEALRRLAILGATHDDQWMADMLRAKSSKNEREADSTLAQALRSSALGNSDEALSASGKAMLLYAATDNAAGYLRAAVEHIYNLQRMGRAGDCLREAALLKGREKLVRYAWMRTYLQLEVTAGHAMLGEAATDRASASAAVLMAKEAKLPIAGLRAVGFVVNIDLRHELYESAWKEAVYGLQEGSAIRGTNMPRYQLLYGLERSAKALDLHWTQAGLADAAVVAATRTTNRQVAAYSLEELALIQLEIGDSTSAAQSFQTADALLRTLGNGTAAKTYLADWKTDRAMLQAEQQNLDGALEMLAQNEPMYQDPDAFYPRLHYYTEYAEILRKSQRTPESLAKAWKAIQDSEQRLASIRTEEERRSWRETTGRAYEILGLDLAQSGDAEMALRAWEWLKSAPYRKAQPLAAGISRVELAKVLPHVPQQSPGRVTLVYARVLDRYVAWSISNDTHVPIRMRFLAVQPTLAARRGASFLRLCSDFHSSTDDVALLGGRLYSDMIMPFQAELDSATQVRLDLDSSLTLIPFAALMHEGRFLGLQHTLLLLPEWWTTNEKSGLLGQASDKLPENPRLLVVQEVSPGSLPQIPRVYDESLDIVKQFPQAHLERATLRRGDSGLELGSLAMPKADLSEVDLVHYAGHGVDEESIQQEPHVSESVMTIARGSLPHCRLAVLAACQTMRERESSAQNVPSVARIFMAAGANHVLATQWDVDSRMTRLLMIRFYAEVADRQTFDEALRRAQQSLQSEPSSSHPYFWSAFELMGQ